MSSNGNGSGQKRFPGIIDYGFTPSSTEHSASVETFVTKIPGSVHDKTSNQKEGQVLSTPSPEDETTYSITTSGHNNAVTPFGTDPSTESIPTDYNETDDIDMIDTTVIPKVHTSLSEADPESTERETVSTDLEGVTWLKVSYIVTKYRGIMSLR